MNIILEIKGLEEDNKIEAILKKLSNQDETLNYFSGGFRTNPSKQVDSTIKTFIISLTASAIIPFGNYIIELFDEPVMEMNIFVDERELNIKTNDTNFDKVTASEMIKNFLIEENEKK